MNLGFQTGRSGSPTVLYCIYIQFYVICEVPPFEELSVFILFHLYHNQDLLLIFITIIDSRKIQTFIYSWVFVIEFSPQQISGLFDFLPWVWARCPGWRGVVQVPQPKVRRGPWESLDKLSLSKRGELRLFFFGRWDRNALARCCQIELHINYMSLWCLCNMWIKDVIHTSYFQNSQSIAGGAGWRKPLQTKLRLIHQTLVWLWHYHWNLSEHWMPEFSVGQSPLNHIFH